MSDEKLDRILLLLEDENIGLCGRMSKTETRIQSLELWRSYLTGGYVVAGILIGIWMGK